MRTIERKHSLAVRLFHWINFFALAMMVWSGLLIYWANPVYRLTLGRYVLFSFFPEPFFEALGVPYRLAEGMSLHFSMMWLYGINGLVYVGYMGLSGEWRYLVPNRHSWFESVQVVLSDLRLRRVQLPPHKFNGAQQVAYTAVILIGAGSLLTGAAIYKPVQLAALTRLLGGYEWARWEHFWLAFSCVVFFAVHVVQVARAGWNTFRAMVTGDELVDHRRGRPIEPPRPGASAEATPS
jgi:thiosulfate reductase cytochrome b subunit